MEERGSLVPSPENLSRGFQIFAAPHEKHPPVSEFSSNWNAWAKPVGLMETPDKPPASPLQDLDEWENDLRRRYPRGRLNNRRFRDYDSEARSGVREFYRLNHRHQTMDFVREKRAEYLPLKKRRMTVWEALEYLNTLVDDSDPDTDLPQIEHLLQTAEAIRADSQPRWAQSLRWAAPFLDLSCVLMRRATATASSGRSTRAPRWHE